MDEYALFNIIQPPTSIAYQQQQLCDPRLRDVPLSIQMIITAKSKPDIEAGGNSGGIELGITLW